MSSCLINPKSSFKSLFVWTPLGKALENLKMSKAVQEGLKPQECEHGSGWVKPPIPYIPEKDDLNETGESSATIKLTLPTRWSYGCLCGHVVPQKSSLCTSSKQSLPLRQRAYRRSTRSLFRPRRDARET